MRAKKRQYLTDVGIDIIFNFLGVIQLRYYVIISGYLTFLSVSVSLYNQADKPPPINFQIFLLENERLPYIHADNI